LFLRLRLLSPPLQLLSSRLLASGRWFALRNWPCRLPPLALRTVRTSEVEGFELSRRFLRFSDLILDFSASLRVSDGFSCLCRQSGSHALLDVGPVNLWGGTYLLSLLTLILNYHARLESSGHPALRFESCWIWSLIVVDPRWC